MGTNHTRSHQFAQGVFHFTIEKYCVYNKPFSASNFIPLKCSRIMTKKQKAKPKIKQKKTPTVPAQTGTPQRLTWENMWMTGLLIPVLSSQWYTDINKDGNIECLVICQKIVWYLLCIFSFCLSREKELCTASCTETYFKRYAGQSGGLKISCREPGEKWVPQLTFTVTSRKHLIHANSKSTDVWYRRMQKTYITN